MPSRDNTLAFDDRSDSEPRTGRQTVEHVLHGVAMLVLVFLIWHAIRLLNQHLTADARGPEVRAALARWSTIEAPTRAHVVLDSAPPPEVRDWIAGLRRSGTRMTWEGGALLPSAVAAEPVVDPKRPTRVWVAAP